MASTKRKESDLFAPVKAWLEERGHEVYSEVKVAKRADIATLHGPAVTVVELKTSLSLDLLEQAQHWMRYADYVYVAVPFPKNKDYFNQYAERLLQHEGIGLLGIEFDDRKGITVTERLHAKMSRQNRGKLRQRLIDSLHPLQKEGHLPGGSAGGGFITTYKITMQGVRDLLERKRRWPDRDGDPEGWVTVREIVDECETHYASPKTSVAKSLIDFEHDWCESKKEGGRLYFRAKVAPPLPQRKRA